MTKTKGAVPRRILLATQLLLIAALYNYAGLMPETFGGRPLLLAAAALSVSACADTPTSVICGALCGALADIFSSGGIGFYAIALSLCGYAIP
ncbi:MAG: rod shape-determining protein MreD, partial [Ruminococcus sp.]|nr:rod shape-determining protein MreD [Ruminococcus sp.]